MSIKHVNQACKLSIQIKLDVLGMLGVLSVLSELSVRIMCVNLAYKLVSKVCQVC